MRDTLIPALAAALILPSGLVAWGFRSSRNGLPPTENKMRLCCGIALTALLATAWGNYQRGLTEGDMYQSASVAVSLSGIWYVGLLAWWRYRVAFNEPPSGWVRAFSVVAALFGAIHLYLLAVVNWTEVGSASLLVVSPPVLMLALGLSIRWISKGFRGQ